MNQEERYVEVLNLALDNKQYYTIDSIYEEYSDLDDEKALKLMKYSIKSNLFKNGLILQANKFNNYWIQIERLFNLLDDIEKSLIIEQLEKIEIWNFVIEEVVFKIALKYSQEMTEEQKIEFFDNSIKRYLVSGISIPIEDYKIIDDTFNCVWLNKKLRTNFFFEKDKLNRHQFNYSSKTFFGFMNSVREIDKDFKYSSLDNADDDNQLSLLYYLIANKNLQYKGKTVFPNDFYKVHIVQRIYAYINTKQGIDLGVNILERLAKSIDPDYDFYGLEMSDFIRKNQSFIINFNKNYKTLIDKKFNKINFEFQTSKFYELPFLIIDELNSIGKVNLIISQLKKFEKNIRIDFFVEKTIEAQNAEIREKLCNDQSWTKNTEFSNLFLNLLIKDKALKEYYKYSITECIMFGLKNNLIDDSLANSFISESLYRGKLNTFDFQLSKLIEVLIDNFYKTNRSVKCYFIDVLFDKTRVEKLNYINVNFNNENKEIDYLEFINTDLGRYYTTLTKFQSDVFETKYQSFINGISRLESKFKPFVSGLFFYQLKNDYIKKYTNDIKLFLGYSNRYNVGIGSDECEIFKFAALNLFEIDADIEVAARNTAVVLCDRFDLTITKLEPKDVGLKFKKRILTKMIDIYFQYENDNQTFVMTWLKWFITNYQFSISIVVTNILRNMHEVDSGKLRILLSKVTLFEKNIIFEKVPEYVFSHIRGLDDFDYDRHLILFKLFEFLNDNNLVIIDSTIVSSLFVIIEKLRTKEFSKIIEKYARFLKNRLPNNDFKNIFEDK